MKRILLVLLVVILGASTYVVLHRSSGSDTRATPSSRTGGDGGGGSAETVSRPPAEAATAAAWMLSPAAAAVPWDQEIHFDDDGLIVHDKLPDGRWDGGDTAQREGFYWFGVWIRESVLHQPWPYTRTKLKTFSEVIKKFEHKTNGQPDGVFYRHPTISGFNNPWDKEWGFSRDQMIPLVAAMGVYGMQDELRRLWNAMPQDGTGKHTFNGRWEVGPPVTPDTIWKPSGVDTSILHPQGVDCDALRKQSCDQTWPCPGDLEIAACNLQFPDPPGCVRVPDPPECPAVHIPGDGDVRDPGCVNARVQAINAINAAVNVCNATRNTAVQAAQQARAGCVAASKPACDARKIVARAECEVRKDVTWKACWATNHFTGDPVILSALNFFRRAMNENPMNPKIYDPPIPLSQGPEGEVELRGGVEARLQAAKDGNNVGDDLNLIVMLLMAKLPLRYGTPISEDAIARYGKDRPHSFGSHMVRYYAEYKGDTTDILNRIKNSGWPPDSGVSPALGALRWYNRPSERANPRLAELYAPILAAFIK